MIYRVNFLGCLIWTILFLWLFFELKLYFIVIAIVIIVLIANFLNMGSNKINEMKNKREQNFEPKMGETYKVCPVCGKDVKRGASDCPHCGYKF